MPRRRKPEAKPRAVRQKEELQRMMDYPWCRNPLHIVSWHEVHGHVYEVMARTWPDAGTDVDDARD
jgi:hypothetical protein